MSTTETNGRPADAPQDCAHCGTSLVGGRFCPGCGNPVAQATSSPAAQRDHAEEEAASTGPVTAKLGTGGADEGDHRAEPAAATTHADAERAQGAGHAFERGTYADDDRRAAHAGAATFAAQAPTAERNHSSSQPPTRGSRRGLFIGGALGATLLAVAAVAAIVLLAGGGDDGPSAGTVYRQQVAKAFGPLLGTTAAWRPRTTNATGCSVTRASGSWNGSPPAGVSACRTT